MDIRTTHPESAWLALLPPYALAVAGLLAAALLLRGALRTLIATHMLRRGTADERALVWAAPIASPGQLMWMALAVGITLAFGASLYVSPFAGLVLAAPVTLLAVWGGLAIYEARYCARLDAALPAATGRLAAQLRAGNGFLQALERVLADTEDGPLRAEWSFISGASGAPLAGGRPAGLSRAVAALASQTPSARHATLLRHIEVAVAQPHDVQTQRIAAAAAALLDAERRRSAAVTELAQMRYSGIVVGAAGGVMSAYLALTQPARAALAYSGGTGLVVGMLVAAALFAPVAAGVLLARVDDLEY